MSDSFNLGTGKGYSNQEIIDAVKRISGKDFTVRIQPKRVGDPPEIYADNRKATSHLSWKATHSDLDTIIKTAWEYYRNKQK